MSTDTAPRLHAREPQVLARDTVYVAAALADDAVTQARKLTARIEELRAEAPAKAKELRETGPEKRIAAFEAQFDAKAAAGAERVATLRDDERVVRVRTALEPVVDQVKIARSQVKGAATSIRKTVDTAVEAGKDLAS